MRPMPRSMFTKWWSRGAVLANVWLAAIGFMVPSAIHGTVVGSGAVLGGFSGPSMNKTFIFPSFVSRAGWMGLRRRRGAGFWVALEPEADSL